MSTILDIWSDPETTGIFTSLNNLDVPWKSDNIYESLNLQYYYNHSGQKNISPLTSAVLGSATSLTDDEKVKLANIAFSMYSKNWKYLYDAIFADYDPIENYNAIEAETIGTSGSRSGSGSESNTGTDTHTLSGTDTETITASNLDHESGTDTTTDTTADGTSETVNQIYGYNSSTAANDSTSTTTVNQTVKHETGYGKSVNHDVSETHSTEYGKTDTETLNLSKSTTDQETTSGNTTRNLTRHGNIGVTTSQQMIESEIELRKHNYFDIIFKDIDNILTLSIY